MFFGNAVNHDQRLDERPDWQKELLQRHQLDKLYPASAQYWFDPLAGTLFLHQKGANRPVLIALNGSQGSGKSMLCAYLDMAIAARHQLYILHETRRIRGSQRREELAA